MRGVGGGENFSAAFFAEWRCVEDGLWLGIGVRRNGG